MANIFGNLAQLQTSVNNGEITGKAAKPTISPLRDTTHYKYQGAGFSIKPIGGDKATWVKASRSYTLTQGKIDLNKVYIAIESLDGDFLLGGTSDAQKVFELLKINLVINGTPLATMLEAYGQHCDNIINRQKAEGTYSASNFKLADDVNKMVK